MAKTPKPPPVHHGKRLYELYEWTRLGQEEFTESIFKKRQWFTWAKDKERLMPSVRIKINEVYGTTDDFWEGKGQLPPRKLKVGEAAAEYISLNKQLQEENARLKETNRKLNEQLVELYSELRALEKRVS